MTDSQLLADFVQTRSSEAFAVIVRRHVDLVYGTARRLIEDEHLAQDVAQAAFVVLAQKAKNVEPRRLPGWLVNATRLAAKKARRAKLCREKHEWRAAQMRSSIVPSADEPTLEELTPLLDEALSRLNETDRTAVVTRFLQGKSFAQVGAAMGSSEDAVRKRVERAVEKLRAVLMKRGVVPSVGGLMVILAAHQAQAAPAGLAGSISATAVSGSAGSSAILAKGVMKMMLWMKVKAAALVIGAVLVAGGVMTVVAETSTTRASTGGRPAAATTPKAADWRSEINAVYGLASGEVVKRIKPPFIPARFACWKATDYREPGDPMPAPDLMLFAWDGKLKDIPSMSWGQVDPLGMVLHPLMGWRSGDYEGPADLLAKRVPGDWVIREGATEQEKLAGLLAILRRDVDPAITIQKQQIEREVIVARGTFEYQPHVDAIDANEVILYSDPYVAADGGRGRSGTLASFLSTMGDCAGAQVVDEVEGTRPATVSWNYLASCFLSERPKDQVRSGKLDSLLRNVGAQTGLALTREKRKVDVWVVGRKGMADADVAGLVQEVRAAEAWIDAVRSFHATVRSTTTYAPGVIEQRKALYRQQNAGDELTPEKHPDLRPRSASLTEIAFDASRAALRRKGLDDGTFSNSIWDGRQGIRESKSSARDEPRTETDPTPHPFVGRLLQEFACFRTAPHPLWFTRPAARADEILDGRAEDFEAAGKMNYHGTECYVLQCPASFRRWYVGVADHRLYGFVVQTTPASAMEAAKQMLVQIASEQGHAVKTAEEADAWAKSLAPDVLDEVAREVSRRNYPLAVPFLEYWMRDYKEVAPGRMFPMTQGLVMRVEDDANALQREMTVEEVEVDRPIAELLFAR